MKFLVIGFGLTRLQFKIFHTVDHILINFDDTHLYGKYIRNLLIGVAYDANNQIFPLAFTLCDIENTKTWTWFYSVCASW